MLRVVVLGLDGCAAPRARRDAPCERSRCSVLLVVVEDRDNRNEESDLSEEIESDAERAENARVSHDR